MNKIKTFVKRIFSIFEYIPLKMKKLVYKIFGEPIARDLGIRGTRSGKLIIDKKVFYKREDVKRTIEHIKSSTVLTTK